jgi:hypothetical protein
MRIVKGQVKTETVQRNLHENKKHGKITNVMQQD